MDKSAIRSALVQELDLDVKEAKILIVGLGDTGLSVANFLLGLNFNFVVVDSRKTPPYQARLQQSMPDIPLFTGGFAKDAFDVATHIIVSPGVSLQQAEIQRAITNNVKLLSDIDLFACSTTAPIVAITGSNGKSTVTTLLGKMAEVDNKKVAIGGNLGVPALDLLADENELYVLELSSFQLERTTKLNAAAAVVLNVTPDHMDRYKNLDEYSAAKQVIYMGDGVMIINLDDPVVSRMMQANRKRLTFSLSKTADLQVRNTSAGDCLFKAGNKLLPVAELSLIGKHNIANALAALALGETMGLNDAVMCKVLRSFRGMDHRMQTIAEIKGATWINDSKATNVGACIAALQGCKDKVILLAGGDAKGADMQALVPEVEGNARAVVLFGKDADLIAQVLDSCVEIFFAKNLQEAVNIAFRIVQAGEIVLLSPACASLDQFKNYQERGQQFTAAVKRLAA